MFHVSVIGQRLNDGASFCAIIHEHDLHCALCAFEEEFPSSLILSFHACNIQGRNYEVRKHSITRNP